MLLTCICYIVLQCRMVFICPFIKNYKCFNYIHTENCPVSVIHGAVLPESKIVSESVVDFIDCLSTCYAHSWCKTVNYNTRSRTCLMTNYTCINVTVNPTEKDWIYVEYKQGKSTFKSFSDSMFLLFRF